MFPESHKNPKALDLMAEEVNTTLVVVLLPSDENACMCLESWRVFGGDRAEGGTRYEKTGYYSVKERTGKAPVCPGDEPHKGCGYDRIDKRDREQYFPKNRLREREP